MYYKSYEQHFENNSTNLEKLIHTAKVLENPHGKDVKATGGVNLQVPAITSYLNRNNLELKGNEVVDIGTFEKSSHRISVRLSPLTIKT